MGAFQLIGAGLGRTGTLSMKAALEELLGGRCYHMQEVLRRPDHIEFWYAWAKDPDRPLDWNWLLKDYVAGVDAPICFFWRELMTAFPEAKVVLTKRDPERWFESFAALQQTTGRVRWLRHFVPRFRKFIPFTDALLERYMEGKVQREANIAFFERHNLAVQQGVASARLLVMDVKEGWQPLCRFLGKPIPRRPFPHLNEGTATIRAGIRRTILGRA